MTNSHSMSCTFTSQLLAFMKFFSTQSSRIFLVGASVVYFFVEARCHKPFSVKALVKYFVLLSELHQLVFLKCFYCVRSLTLTLFLRVVVILFIIVHPMILFSQVLRLQLTTMEHPSGSLLVSTLEL